MTNSIKVNPALLIFMSNTLSQLLDVGNENLVSKCGSEGYTPLHFAVSSFITYLLDMLFPDKGEKVHAILISQIPLPSQVRVLAITN